MKILKWIKYILLGALLCFAAYIIYFLFLYNEVPKTKPNVNHLEVGNLSSKEVIFTNAWGDEMPIEEFDLVVPEIREDEASNHISLHFKKITSSNASPGAPIFFLAGGPGTPGSSILRRSYFYIFKRLSELADVVILDQRGTGHSIPHLRCRNAMDLPPESSSDWENDMLSDIIKKCKECADEFIKMNINLQGYNSLESARDIEDVRIALGYDSISILGYSYGTTLAQHYVALYEDKVSKLILPGPTAPDLNPKLPAILESQYIVMDSLIRSDSKMSKYIPDLVNLMKDQHQRLNTNPMKIELPLMDAVGDDDGVFFTTIFKVISLFKPSWKLTLTDTHMKMMMAQNSGRSGWTRIAPRYYYQLSKGEYNRLGNYLRNFRRQAMPNALFFTVAGSTKYDQDRWNASLLSRDDGILDHFAISFGRYPEVLGQFKVDQIKGLNQPIHSELELLLIGGTLDGKTPIANLDTLSERFPNHQQIIVHNGSHDDLIDGEVLEMMIKYLNDDTLSTVNVYRQVGFLPPVNYKYSIQDTLEKIRIEKGIESAIDRYEVLRSEYLLQEDYLYDVSEATLNNFGYRLMDRGLNKEAEYVLMKNAGLFPNSFNTYNSLAEAQIANGKYREATSNLKKAIELNYLDGYSHGLLKKYGNQD